MSIALPATATCRFIGHAWVLGLNYTQPTTETHQVCSRCGAANQRRRVYVPRHLREG